MHVSSIQFAELVWMTPRKSMKEQAEHDTQQ